MADEMKLIQERKNALLIELGSDESRYRVLAKINYYCGQIFLWASRLAAGLAAILGLIPAISAQVDKRQIGTIGR